MLTINMQYRHHHYYFQFFNQATSINSNTIWPQCSGGRNGVKARGACAPGSFVQGAALSIHNTDTRAESVSSSFLFYTGVQQLDLRFGVKLRCKTLVLWKDKVTD